MSTKSFCSANHILVGLGGTGGKILREFKKRMFEEFHTQEEREKQPIAILYVDSTNEMMPKDGRPHPDFRVLGQDASFTNSEFVNIKAVDVGYILDHIDNYPSVKGIVSNVNTVKSAIGALGEAAGQKRRAGRLLFAVNAPHYIGGLKKAYKHCEDVSGNSAETYIHIMAGLCGGTGSGSIVDAVVQTRKAFPNAIISVYAMIPEENLPKANMDQGRYYPNGYAALMELNALQAGCWFPQDVTGNGPAKFAEETHRGFDNDRKGVANGLTLYSNVNENGLTINSLTELPKIVSDYLYARIFLLDVKEDANADIKRAYTFENIDDNAFEKDETANPDTDGDAPVIRTNKINSFGIKRVIYPSRRILQHITYTVGESILYQFKYNNWRDNQGYVDEERNRDYRYDFMNGDNLQNWMLDFSHLTLERKVLDSDPDYPTFNDYWHGKAVERAEEAKAADCPLQELDNILGDFYQNYFREEGVEGYYKGKERIISDIAKEIRHKVESELFEKWKLGDISIVELQKVSKLLLEKMGEIRTDLETKSREEKENYDNCDLDRTDNVAEWSRLGVLQRMINKGARLYADHQNILTDYYTSKTMLVAWEFAKKLAAKLLVELTKMDADISSFGQKINEAITETEKLIAGQQKVNKGLEDMKGSIIEVSEDETMDSFEVELKTDKIDMQKIASQIRTSILPSDNFVNFGRLATDISTDRIRNAFDRELSDTVLEMHDVKIEKEKKILGLNILTQLRQKLRTDDDIKEFATKIVRQSGAFLKLNENQIRLQLRNNESKDASLDSPLNKKVILVSIPSPDDDLNLKDFASKLERALKDAVPNATGMNLSVNMKSPRKEELSIITVSYCFPMRAIEWLNSYKQKYEDYLNTGNPTTDMQRAILLHSEGTGKDLPSLFAVDKMEEAMADTKASSETQMPPAMPTTKPVTPPLLRVLFRLHIAIGGQQYGPYNIDQCKQMVASGQLTRQSVVWMEGLDAWTEAGQVPALATLFAPAPPTNMPPLPPSGGPTPPSMI